MASARTFKRNPLLFTKNQFRNNTKERLERQDMTEINPFSPNTPTQQTTPMVDKMQQGEMSHFHKFLGHSATKEQVAKFINQWVTDIIRQIRKDEQKMKETLRKMRTGEP